MLKNSKYKKIYETVLSFGYAPTYVKKQNNLLSLYIYPKDYELHKSIFYKVSDINEEQLIKRIKRIFGDKK
jgi:hypothetical protein